MASNISEAVVITDFEISMTYFASDRCFMRFFPTHQFLIADPCFAKNSTFRERWQQRYQNQRSECKQFTKRAKIMRLFAKPQKIVKRVLFPSGKAINQCSLTFKLILERNRFIYVSKIPFFERFCFSTTQVKNLNVTLQLGMRSRRL